jgi:hypothetical protein
MANPTEPHSRLARIHRESTHTRRSFLLGASTTLFAASHTSLFAAAFAPDHAESPLKIESVELIEFHGRYTDEAGVNRQQQVNPLDIYDDLRPAPYTDKPSGTREVAASAVYLRIRTAGGPEGLYGPIEKMQQSLSTMIFARSSSAKTRSPAKHSGTRCIVPTATRAMASS